MTSLDQLIHSTDPSAVPHGIESLLPMPEDHMGDDFFEDSMDANTTDSADTQAVDFSRNLVDELDDITLEELAIDILQKIETDKESRRPHMDMIDKVKDQINIGGETTYEAPFDGAEDVIYPIIAEAQLQFQARALPQVFPVDPAKGVVMGESNELLDEKALRIGDVINYQIQYQDRGNRKDFAQMLWWLPIVGSTFRYGRYDPIRKMNVFRFVSVEDFIVPYKTTSLEDAPHFTRQFYDSANTIRKLQRLGFYSKNVDIGDYGDVDDDDSNPVQELKDDSDGMQETADNSKKLVTEKCYDIYIDLDLPGFEDVDPDGNVTPLGVDEESSGVELPYIVTLHAASKKPLAIRFNWKQGDEMQLKRVPFAHYKYLTGPGFYGNGLPNIIGTLQEAASGVLRAIGDGLGFAMFKGGWKLKNAKMDGERVFRMGEFLDVDSDIDDINKSIKVAEFAPPPSEAFNYLELLDNKAKSMVSIQDVMTGDSNPQNAPVGTTLALIEQASKILTNQHGNLVESFTEELDIMVDLNHDHMPDNVTFMMPGKVIRAQRSDFDDSVAVQPTANPAVASFQQRMAQTQAVAQLAQEPQFAPFFRDKQFPLLRRILGDMDAPAIDEIVITEAEYQAMVQQAAQNPAPPPPEVTKANAAMTIAQAKAKEIDANIQTSQTTAIKDHMDSQSAAISAAADAKQQDIDNEHKKTDQQLAEKSMDLDYITRNKQIDAQFLGGVAPALMQTTDALATEQSSKILSDDGEGAAITPPPMTPQQKALHEQMISAAHQHAASIQSQQPPMPPQQGGAPGQPPAPPPPMPPQGMPPAQQPQVPVKQGMLAALMNKIRGK